MTTQQTEVYPNAPLGMVAFELRIPHALSLADRAAQAQVWEKIKERLPITQPQPALQVTLGAPGMMQQAQGSLRMLDRGRTLGVVVAPESVVVETTNYHCYEEFRDFLLYVLLAVPPGEIAGFSRIGLRYINEIRVPGVGSPSQWAGLVAPSLLGATEIATEDLIAHSLRSEVEYEGLDDLRVVMRFGAATGRIVNAEGPLRTRTNDSGPFFFIDLDSYWENAPDNELPEFSTEAIVEITSRLREPIHNMFEGAITNRLRETFRRELR